MTGWAGRTAPHAGQSAARSCLVTAGDLETWRGVEAPGGLAAALLNTVVAEEVPGPGTTFLRLDLHFLAPIRPGDVVTGRATVISVADLEPVSTLDVEVVRDDGVVAVRGTAVCRTVAFPGVGPTHPATITG